jgi:hypothetical protein
LWISDQQLGFEVEDQRLNFGYGALSNRTTEIPNEIINFYLQTRRAREAGVQSEKRVGVHQQDSLAVPAAGSAAQIASYYDPAAPVASYYDTAVQIASFCRRISCSSSEFLPPDQLLN